VIGKWLFIEVEYALDGGRSMSLLAWGFGGVRAASGVHVELSLVELL